MVGAVLLGEIEELASRFEGQPPQAVLEWVLGAYGDQVCLACSFGAEDMVLVDMACRIRPWVHVFYLDTGLLFDQTLEVIREVEKRYPLRLWRVVPELTLAEQAGRYGDRLWLRDPNQCCRLRKVEPLRRFLQGYDAWITGIRREQAPTRASARPVEWDATFGKVKVNPLVGWRWGDVWAYIRRQRVPHNPLHHQGFPSVGCLPCTTPVRPGEHPRAGRWRGLEKTECGLHLPRPTPVPAPAT